MRNKSAPPETGNIENERDAELRRWLEGVLVAAGGRSTAAAVCTKSKLREPSCIAHSPFLRDIKRVANRHGFPTVGEVIGCMLDAFGDLYLLLHGIRADYRIDDLKWVNETRQEFGLDPYVDLDEAALAEPTNVQRAAYADLDREIHDEHADKRRVGIGV